MVLEIYQIRYFSKWVTMREKWNGMLGMSDEYDVFLGSDWLWNLWETSNSPATSRRGKGWLICPPRPSVSGTRKFST